MMKSISKSWEKIDCILCGEQSEAVICWPDEDRGHIVRCRRCDLVYRSPRRREDDQTRHFEEEWTEARPAFQLEDYRTKNLRSIADWILKRHPLPGAILDVGSSYGNLLAQFPVTWKRFGVEPSRTARQISQERLPGANIFPGTLGSAPLPGRIFDVITIVDTIYYLHYPLRDLRRLKNLLKPDGVLIIEAQNFANRGKVYRWVKHAFDDTWMYFYTPKSLEKILNKAGMKLVARFGLPGHRIGSKNYFARIITTAEFVLLEIIKGLSASKLDFMPHFVLVAQPKTR